MDFGWLVAIALVAFDVFLALYANPLRNKKVIGKLWNEPVELEGLDGSVIKVKIPVLDAKGEHKIDAKGQPMYREEVPPLWLGITLGVGGHLKSSFFGQVGARKKQMERQILEGLTPDQAAWATALESASKGKVGQAFMQLMLPSVMQYVQNRIQSGVVPSGTQNAPQGYQVRGGGPI